MLSTAVPAARMGVYMGVFNLFIVIPQIVMSLIVPRIYNSVLGGDPRNAVVLGGFSFLLAAVSVLIVRDVHGTQPEKIRV
jgi:maltose/moltooligosaccharide transporter